MNREQAGRRYVSIHKESGRGMNDVRVFGPIPEIGGRG